MIKPGELESEGARLTWNTIVDASQGDVTTLRKLIEQTPRLGLAEYWYTPAIHFAVREGHLEAVRILLDSGAHPEWNGLHDRSLIQMVSERGHLEIGRLLEETRDRRGIICTQPTDHAIRAAAARGDVAEVGRLLAADPGLVDLGDSCGAAPLHRAVCGGSVAVMHAAFALGACRVRVPLSSFRVTGAKRGMQRQGQ